MAQKCLVSLLNGLVKKDPKNNIFVLFVQYHFFIAFMDEYLLAHHNEYWLHIIIIFCIISQKRGYYAFILQSRQRII
jgi:hypothetical protein